MNAFEFQNPVRVIFGIGSLRRAGGEAAKLGKRALVVSYSNGGTAATLDALDALLKQAGVASERFCKVEPNPDIAMVAEGVAAAKAMRADLVIGVGGGSAMDSAKAIAAGVLYKGGDLWNMVYARHDKVDAVPPVASLPTLMIPTLPATGSEMNNCAVVSNGALREKSYIWSPCLFAKVAILDPELTYTLPPFQTACGGVDSISHVLEIYINGQDESDLLHDWQEGVMRTLLANLPVALANPRDAPHARSELMWSATCALNGWASPGDAWTPMHQVGHVLTSHFKVNHGSSLAIIMPAWMSHFKTLKPDRYYAFARNVMKVDPHRKSRDQIIDDGIAAFKAFIKKSGLPVSLGEKGITAADIPTIVEGVRTVSFNAQGTLTCNPPVTAAALAEILKEAL